MLPTIGALGASYLLSNTSNIFSREKPKDSFLNTRIGLRSSTIAPIATAGLSGLAVKFLPKKFGIPLAAATTLFGGLGTNYIVNKENQYTKAHPFAKWIYRNFIDK